MDLKEGLLFADRYTLVHRIGGGSFSEVWEVSDNKVAGTVFALKIFKIDNDDYVENLMHEFKLMCNLNDQHLLTPQYYDIWNGLPYLVLHYCSEGSTEKYIGKMDEQQIVKLLYDVASGLKYLHNGRNPIIHQDIKPDNILVDHNHYMITDFGVSTETKKTIRKDSPNDISNAGTITYFAPERFSDGYVPITSSDIWSLGATAYELITGELPFGTDGGLMQYSNNLSIPDLPSKYNRKLNKLIKNCLNKEPWDRPKAEDIVEQTYCYLEEGKWGAPKKRSRKNKVARLTVILLLVSLLAAAYPAGTYINTRIKQYYEYKIKENLVIENNMMFNAYVMRADSLMAIAKNAANENDFSNYLKSINELEKALLLKRYNPEIVDTVNVESKIDVAESMRIELLNREKKAAMAFIRIKDWNRATKKINVARALANDEESADIKKLEKMIEKQY